MSLPDLFLFFPTAFIITRDVPYLLILFCVGGVVGTYVYMWALVHAHSHKQRPEVRQHPPPCFLRQDLSPALGAHQIRRGWLSGQLQEPPCLCLLRAVIIGGHYCTVIFPGVLGSNSAPHVFRGDTSLSCLPSPLPQTHTPWRITSKWLSSCLSLPDATIAGIHHHISIIVHLSLASSSLLIHFGMFYVLLLVYPRTKNMEYVLSD